MVLTGTAARRRATPEHSTMPFLGSIIWVIARILQSLGTLLQDASDVLKGFLPALLAPPRLITLVKDHYDTLYHKRLLPRIIESHDDEFPSWEAAMVDAYGLRTGTVLILGCGWGFQTIALARRGLAAIGVDHNPIALRGGVLLARNRKVSAHFHMADFLRLPYRFGTFDAILLGTCMYSSIPGASRRQTWLADLLRLLTPTGLLMLTFPSDHDPVSRRQQLNQRINPWLVKLPGTNHTYQPTDDWRWGHFHHVFPNEDEIRSELLATGARIVDLNWINGFAVLTASP